MELHFDDCFYLRDFESFGSVPDGWVDDPENWYVRFKAYDCVNCENGTETDYWERWFDFDCEVKLVCDPFDGNGMTAEWVLAEFPAKDEKEAERLLQVAADALYGRE